MNTLSDRYLWAAVRTVPEQQRPDFGRELRERIGDSIDSHIERGTAPEQAERAALAELGDPAQLAAAYIDRPLQLIGPRYFLTWRRLLTTLLITVLPVATGAVLLGQVLSGASVGQIFGNTAATVLSVAVHLVFWTTFIFAILERTQGSSTPITKWTPKDLPHARDNARAGRLGDLIATAVFLTLFAAAIIWQQWGAIFRDGVMEPMPVLDPTLWSFWIPYFLGLLVVEAIFAAAVYLRGWNRSSAGLNVLLNFAFAVPALWLFLTNRLLNPAVLEAIRWPSSEEADAAVRSVIVFVVVGIAIWDMVDGFIKAARHRAGSSLGGI
ncbi:permease prefix domain 1-containing protein [Arthrobacter sp.]|uniref:permease prefix domain 1-containing protein n=1 Tax=Arthrobacter sp. TaxID=1667 RepID=UPI003393001A